MPKKYSPVESGDEMVVRKLRAGAKHYVGDLMYEGGEEVEVTEGQSRAFNDKFVPEENPRKAQRVAKAPGIADTSKVDQKDLDAAANFRPVPTSHTPQDIGAKTTTPGLPDSNPGNAVRAARPPVASNPTDNDVDGYPPIRSSYVAANVGGNVRPEDLAVGTPGADAGETGSGAGAKSSQTAAKAPAAQTAGAKK